ncbi:MAG: hypothetical protein H3C63_08185 [Candidatus Omnitrophica bacterium]|nr:hypothetical protein [Candidatus Omnitrophota bacterium]
MLEGPRLAAGPGIQLNALPLDSRFRGKDDEGSGKDDEGSGKDDEGSGKDD